MPLTDKQIVQIYDHLIFAHDMYKTENEKENVVKLLNEIFPLLPFHEKNFK